MGRCGTAIGLLVCLLGATQTAHALSETAPALRGGAQSVCTEPLLMTPDEARDALLDEAPPRSAALLIEALRALPPPPSDEELPWCASAEDPRCSPLPAQSTPPELAVRVLAATVLTDKTTLARVPAREITHVACADGLPPASGVHARVERPPR